MKLKIILTNIIVFSAFLLPNTLAKPNSDGGFPVPELPKPIKPLTVDKKLLKPIPEVELAVVEKPKPAPAPRFSGSCSDWVNGAGIDDKDSAYKLIDKESDCDPYATNPSSGACGVAQELPCGKSGCSLGDGACQVKWMNRYVLDRYGSWFAALSFHYANNYY